MKRTALKRKSYMKRSTTPAKAKTPVKRKRISQTSAKKKAEAEVRREVMQELVRLRGEDCEANITGGPGIFATCTMVATDGHEILTRARGGSATEPENILLVCRNCHDWIHNNPVKAKQLGFLKSATA